MLNCFIVILYDNKWKVFSHHENYIKYFLAKAKIGQLCKR